MDVWWSVSYMKLECVHATIQIQNNWDENKAVYMKQVKRKQIGNGFTPQQINGPV